MKREVGQGGCPTGRPGSGLKDLEINAAVLSSRRKVPVKSKAGMRSVDLKGCLISSQTVIVTENARDRLLGRRA